MMVRKHCIWLSLDVCMFLRLSVGLHPRYVRVCRSVVRDPSWLVTLKHHYKRSILLSLWMRSHVGCGSYHAYRCIWQRHGELPVPWLSWEHYFLRASCKRHFVVLLFHNFCFHRGSLYIRGACGNTRTCLEMRVGYAGASWSSRTRL